MSSISDSSFSVIVLSVWPVFLLKKSLSHYILLQDLPSTPMESYSLDASRPRGVQFPFVVSDRVLIKVELLFLTCMLCVRLFQIL